MAKEALRSTSDAPSLDLPPVLDTSNEASSVVTDQPESAQDVREAMAASKFFKNATVKFAGGALPSLFPEDPRPGAQRVVRYTGWEHIEWEGTHFDMLRFDTLDPSTGKVKFAASMVAGATLEKYFQLERAKKGADGKDFPKGQGPLLGKPREPSKTPILLITFGGLGKITGKRNPPKKWIIEEVSVD